MAKATIDTKLVKQSVVTEVAVEEITLVMTRAEAQYVYHMVNGSEPLKDGSSWGVYNALRRLGFTQLTP